MVNNVSCANIARLNPDGSPDTTFSPESGTDSPVTWVRAQNDGEIMIAGYFSKVNGIPRQRIARL